MYPRVRPPERDQHPPDGWLTPDYSAFALRLLTRHDWWRDRYKVAADNLANRPKVRSIGWHRLRANVAALVDWLRICVREGWLGSARRNNGKPTRPFDASGRKAARQLAGMRLRIGIAQPYGKKAVKLGLGDEPPPSRREARGP